MKLIKNILAAAAVLSSAAAFSAANDALVSFSSKGPDAYADGTTVLDGECYALVWMANGASGLSVAADGSATGGEIVLAAPVAKGGRCPKVVFEVDAGDMKTKYQGGSWGVYLLDTRRWGADGAAKLMGHTFSGGYTLDWLALFWIGVAALSVVFTLIAGRGRKQ